MSTPVPPRRLWLVVLGFVFWCSALVILYAAHAIGCTFGWPTGALRLFFAVTLLLHLAAIGWLCRMPADSAFGPTGAFMRWVIISVSIAAFVAVVITLGPALLLTTCV